MRTLILALIVSCVASGCATINDAKELRVGMTADEIRDKIGSPSGKMIDRDHDIDVYTVQTMGKGLQWAFGLMTAGLSCAMLPRQNVYIEMESGKLVRVR